MRPFALALVALALAVAVGSLMWFTDAGPERAGPVPEEPTSAVGQEEPPADLTRATDATAEARSSTAPAEAPVASPNDPAPPAAARALEPQTVFACDLRGEAVPGVRLQRSGAEAQTGPDGLAAMPRRKQGVLAGLFGKRSEEPDVELAKGSGLVAVARGTLRAGARDGMPAIVVAQMVDIAGEVLDADGLAIAEAKVMLEGLEPLLEFPHTLDPLRTARLSASERSDGEGRFRLEGVPLVPWARLSARAPGHARTSVALAELDLERARLTLERAGEAPGGPTSVAVEGTVLLPGGAPAEGASLRFVDGSTVDPPRTASDGSFRIELRKPQASDGVLAASLEGHGTTVYRSLHADVLSSWPEPPPPLTLVLPGRELAIRGRVVDANGEPQPNWTVGLFSGSELAEGHIGTNSMIERTQSTGTGSDGAFELTGLIDRDYEIVAYRASSGLAFRRGPVPAGTEGYELVIDAEAFVPQVEGRVETFSGEPLAGAQVSTSTTIMRMTSGGGTVSQSIGGPSATADANGSFVLRDVPRDLASLSVQAPGGTRVATDSWPVEELDLDRPLLLRVPELRPLQVTVQGARSDDPDVFLEARDALGHSVTWTTFDGGGSSSTTRLSWSWRRFAVQWVSEAAVEVVLLVRDEDGEIVERERAAIVWQRDGSPAVVRLSLGG